MITFANSLFLAALAGVALPVLIHALTRPRPRTVRFPTFHLLLEAGQGRQALDRLRTWLVLALRTLAVAALALAFVRPQYNRSVLPTAGTDGPRRVVLVIDASLSMRATGGGVTGFAQARSQAADLLRGLENGSEAAVIYAGATPRAVLPALSRNLSLLHQDLAQAEATLEGGDMPAALALAESLLGGQGQVYVFSDFQRADWSMVDFARHPGLAFLLRPVRDDIPENVGLVAVEKSPEEPLADETVEVVCRVFNSSPRQRVETVQVEIEGAAQSAEVTLQPYRSSEARFLFAAPPVGVHPGRVRLRSDALAEDDSRCFALRVRQAMRALVICDDSASDPTSAAFYVKRALAPSDEAGRGLEILHRRGQDLDQRSLETSDLFFLVSPVQLIGSSPEILARRVTDGAGLFLFLDGADAARLPAALAAVSADLAPPLRLLDAVRPPQGECWQEVITHQGPLQVFHDPEQGALGSLRFYRYLRNEIDPARQTEVLARYPDGSAALTFSPAGRGRMVCANFLPSPSAADLPGSPLFPALLHELLRALRQQNESDDGRPGRAWQASLRGGSNDTSDCAVLAPDGAPCPVDVLGRGRLLRLGFPPPGQVGHYAVQVDGSVVDYAVVNTDPRESDLRPLDVASLLDPESGAAVQVLDAHDELSQAGQPLALWPLLLTVAVAAFALEMLVLALWRKTPLRRMAGGTR